MNDREIQEMRERISELETLVQSRQTELDNLKEKISEIETFKKREDELVELELEEKEDQLKDFNDVIVEQSIEIARLRRMFRSMNRDNDLMRIQKKYASLLSNPKFND